LLATRLEQRRDPERLIVGETTIKTHVTRIP
jgi:hypothetical protein